MIHPASGFNPIFNDAYFTPNQGWEESCHVFFYGNNLDKHLSHWSRGIFRIGELGFGTGLNLWTLLSLIGKYIPPMEGPRKLEFFSVEAHPLNTGEVVNILQPYSEDLGGIVSFNKMIRLYDELRSANGFSGSFDFFWCGIEVAIKIWWTDVHDFLADLKLNQFEAEVWFLDGHDPKKNPALWTPEVLESVYHCTCPGGTASTFTSAGTVKSTLRNVGFDVTRKQGFGKKRHMVYAKKPPALDQQGKHQLPKV